jgi:hypothetical protein
MIPLIYVSYRDRKNFRNKIKKQTTISSEVYSGLFSFYNKIKPSIIPNSPAQMDGILLCQLWHKRYSAQLEIAPKTETPNLALLNLFFHTLQKIIFHT